MKSISRLLLRLLGLIVSFSLLIIGCVTGCSNIDKSLIDRSVLAEVTQDDILIGLAYPTEEMDKSTLFIKGIQMALEEINSSGGINGRKIKLLIKNDEASVTTGAAVAQSFAENPEVVAVIGHWNSRVSIAAAGIYEKAGIVMISPASTSPELTKKGYKYVFCQIPSDEKIGKAMAEYAAQKGYKKVVIYYADDEYGRGLANSFEDNAKANGVKVVDRVTEFGEGQYFRNLIDRWNAFGYDAFFVADVMPNGGTFVEKLRDNGINAPVLGATGLDRSSYIETLGTKADGTVVPTLFKLNSTDERVKDFVQSFKIKYAEDPDVWAAQGYDTLKILAHAIERAVSTASYDIAASLNQIRDWEGVTGKLSFSETGEIQGKTISKKIVRNGKFQFLEE